MFIRKRNNYTALSDEELVIRYKLKPDNSVFSELYKRYGHLSYGVGLKYLKNTSDAEDIVMSIFERLPGKIQKHEISNFKSWLYSVVKNECLMKLRKNEHFTYELNNELEADYNLEQVLSLERKLDILEKAIGYLNEEQQACITLFYIEKKSYQEISTIRNMELMKVKSAIQNGKRNLKIKLEGHHEFKSTK